MIKLHALHRCALHQNYFIFDKSKINLDLKNFFGGDIHWENGKLNHIAKCKYIYLPFSSSKLQAQRAYMCSIATCSKCFGMLECTWAISQEPLGQFFENLPEYILGPRALIHTKRQDMALIYNGRFYTIN